MSRATVERRAEVHRPGQAPGRHHFFDVTDDEVHQHRLREAEHVAEPRHHHVAQRADLPCDLLQRMGEVLDDDDRLAAGVVQLMHT